MRAVATLDLADPSDGTAVRADPGAPEALLGAVLAGLSEAALTAGAADPLCFTDALARDFEDRIFDGTAPGTAPGTVEPVFIAGAGPLSPAAGTSGLAQATAAFLGGSRNRSGASASDFGALAAALATRDEAPAGNVAPNFEPIAARFVPEDAGPQAISVTGVTAGTAAEDAAGQPVTFALVSSDPALGRHAALLPADLSRWEVPERDRPIDFGYW